MIRFRANVSSANFLTQQLFFKGCGYICYNLDSNGDSDTSIYTDDER